MPDNLQITVLVRDMQPSDAAAVAQLTVELGYERTPEQIAAWLAYLETHRTEQAVFVACVADQVIGWIEVSIERRLQHEPFGLIGGLVVRDGARSRGIGRLLCEHAERWAWKRGMDRLRVTSRSNAHRFYLRDGYQEVKTSLVFEKILPNQTKQP